MALVFFLVIAALATQWSNAAHAIAEQKMLLNTQDRHHASHLSTLQIGPATEVPR